MSDKKIKSMSPGDQLMYIHVQSVLYRSGDVEGATFRLRQTTLSNLYLVTDLLGDKEKEPGIRHSSNPAQKDYTIMQRRRFMSYGTKKSWSGPERRMKVPSFSVSAAGMLKSRSSWTQIRIPEREKLVQESFRLRLSKDV